MITGPGDILGVLFARARTAVAQAQRVVARSEVVTAASRVVRDPATMAKRCAWCGRLDLGGGWHEPAGVPRFIAVTLERHATHTICPDCVHRLEESGQSVTADDVSAHRKQPRDAEPEDEHGEP